MDIWKWMAIPVIVSMVGWSGASGVSAADNAPSSATQSERSAEEQARFESRIREYILAHPEVLIESLNAYRAQIEENERQQASAALISHRDALQNDPSAPVIGNPEGSVTIVEFFDYRCPYCVRVLPTIQELLASDNSIRYVLREYPVLGPDSVTAARASLAVWNLWPDRYMDFHTALLKSRGGLNEDRVMAVARSLGLDVDAIKDRMEQPDVSDALEKSLALGRALKINGTPAFVVGDQLVPGAVSLSTLQQLVEIARDG